VRGQSVRILGLDPDRSHRLRRDRLDRRRCALRGERRDPHDGQRFSAAPQADLEGVLVLMREHAPTEVAIEARIHAP